jgi:hypothetical protein
MKAAVADMAIFLARVALNRAAKEAQEAEEVVGLPAAKAVMAAAKMCAKVAEKIAVLKVMSLDVIHHTYRHSAVLKKLCPMQILREKRLAMSLVPIVQNLLRRVCHPRVAVHPARVKAEGGRRIRRSRKNDMKAGSERVLKVMSLDVIHHTCHSAVLKNFCPMHIVS